ncbi:MAG: ArsR family transcriptional regulator [Vicinamibacterales bacterium]
MRSGRQACIFTHVGEHYEAGLDATFFALSHRSRRRLLLQLSEGHEQRVTDLAGRHRLSLNSVSKHIIVLERARLVRRRVVGRDHFIRVDAERLHEAERWLEHHRQFWTTQLDGLARLFETRKGRTPR